MRLGRFAGLAVVGDVVIGVVVVGCATHQAPAEANLSPGSPSRPPSAGGLTGTIDGRSPTPTSRPTQTLGPVTVPLPTGVDSLRVTFAGGATTVYQKSINDPATIATIVDQVNALHDDTGATQGCAMSPVTMRLDFVAPSANAVYVEDTGCARATLSIGGAPATKLDASLTGSIEQLLGVTITFGPSGGPIVGNAPALSS